VRRSLVTSVAIVLFGLLGGTPAVMAQIAPGVTQSAAHTATITGTVSQSDGTPVVGADVKLTGPATLSTKSDNHGVFTFTSVPWGIYQIVVNSLLGTVSRTGLTVNSDTNVAVRYNAQASGLRTIAHVSTSSAGASINVTPANIASMNPSDYAFQGNSSWRTLLSQIPGVTVGGGLLGGFSVTDTIPDSPFKAVVLSINGALPYETSTTLDGMPLANTSYNSTPGSGVDLAFLPMAVFDTADIVRGPGADAPSIVDSIGGSFVLHAPSQIDKDAFEYSVSNDPYGGILSNAKAAVRLGRLSATVVYGFYNSPGPFANANIINAFAFPPATVGGVAFGCAPSACATYASNNKYLNCDCEPQTPLLYCCVSLNTAWSQHNGAVALAYDIAPSLTAQVFYAGAASRTLLPFEGYSVGFLPGSGYTGGISPGLHDYIAVQGPPIASQSESLLEERLTAYVGGGVLRVAALQNNSWSTEYIANLMPPNGEYTLWGTGEYGTPPGTPVVFNGVREDLTFPQEIIRDDTQTNNRDIFISYAQQLGPSMDFGASYVTSYYNSPCQFSFALPAYSLVISSSQPTAVSETTQETRLYFNAEPSAQLSLDASWYFAQAEYHVPNPNDANAWTNSQFQYNAPRLGAVWRFNQNSVLRAAVGGGYALPLLSYLVGTNAPFCFGGACTVTVPNLGLRPEESFGLDAGTDMRLQRDTVLSFDVYRANLYGQFFQSTNLTGTFTGLPLYTTQYNNLSQSRYEGINFALSHNPAKGVYWHGSFGLTRAYVVSVPAGFYDGTTGFPATPCVNCQNTYIIPGINYDGEFQSTVPYANAAAQVGYRWTSGKYLDLSPTYYGRDNPYFEPAFVEWDVHGGYAVTKNVSILVTVRNVTGVYDGNYQYINPATILGAPTISGLPYPIYPLPYGPRTLIVTANFKSD